MGLTQEGKFTRRLVRSKKTFYSPSPTQRVNACVLCVSQVARYVWNKTDFDAVDPETTDYLMGKFCCYLFLPS